MNTSGHLSPEIIGVVYAYTFFYTMKNSSSLGSTDQAKSSFFDLAHITKTFQGHGKPCWPHMESAGTGTKHLGSQSARSLGWISLRGEWRLSCTPLSEITKLSVELVKYARKKGCTQKSDNRERQS